MPKQYASIPKILEISSRRVVTRALIVPTSKRVALALLTSTVQEDGSFSIIFADYSFMEKTKGNIVEKIEISRELGTSRQDPGIVRAMEKIMAGWERISPNWILDRERILESYQGSLQPTTLGDRIHEALSRAQTRVHFEAQFFCNKSIGHLIQIFDSRLGAMLSENRAW